jgi:hypothetical protein
MPALAFEEGPSAGARALEYHLGRIVLQGRAIRFERFGMIDP